MVNGASGSQVFIWSNSGGTVANKIGNAITFDAVTTHSLGTTIGSGGSKIAKHVVATTVWNPGIIANGASVSTTIAVTGALANTTCTATHDQIQDKVVTISAVVNAGGSVRVVISNTSGAPVTVSNGNLYVACDIH